jgi:hypothetical protein
LGHAAVIADRLKLFVSKAARGLSYTALTVEWEAMIGARDASMTSAVVRGPT